MTEKTLRRIIRDEISFAMANVVIGLGEIYAPPHTKMGDHKKWTALTIQEGLRVALDRREARNDTT